MVFHARALCLCAESSCFEGETLKLNCQELHRGKETHLYIRHGGTYCNLTIVPICQTLGRKAARKLNKDNPMLLVQSHKTVNEEVLTCFPLLNTARSTRSSAVGPRGCARR